MDNSAFVADKGTKRQRGKKIPKLDGKLFF